jgi:hypothetical protein
MRSDRTPSWIIWHSIYCKGVIKGRCKRLVRNQTTTWVNNRMPLPRWSVRNHAYEKTSGTGGFRGGESEGENTEQTEDHQTFRLFRFFRLFRILQFDQIRAVFSSRPWTCAGGLVASTAVNGSRTL